MEVLVRKAWSVDGLNALGSDRGPVTQGEIGATPVTRRGMTRARATIDPLETAKYHIREWR